MWQFQHLALGLDVIGNPAKLLNSFQTGAKDLVIKSREGIVEGYVGSGIALGIKSFLGHVVGEDISINSIIIILLKNILCFVYVFVRIHIISESWKQLGLKLALELVQSSCGSDGESV